MQVKGMGHVCERNDLASKVDGVFGGETTCLFQTGVERYQNCQC